MAKTILVIGRFQPFHKGHSFLLGKLSDKGKNTLKIAVGSSNSQGARNPFSYLKREKMLKSYFDSCGISNFRIFPVPDTCRDVTWLVSLLKRAGHFDYAVSGNPFVRSVFSRAKLPVRSHRFLRRAKYSGRNVRKLIKSGSEKWKACVEKGVARIIEKNI